jgi:hypothetical protein
MYRWLEAYERSEENEGVGLSSKHGQTTALGRIRKFTCGFSPYLESMKF